MRKKVDDRIRSLIENGVKTRHRSLFVIIGDKSRDQVVNLHYMLSKTVIKSRPTVLWCYKEKLQLSRGLLDPEKVDPFSLFLESGVVSHCMYRDSERILGSTYGMCILQSDESEELSLLKEQLFEVFPVGPLVGMCTSLDQGKVVSTFLDAILDKTLQSTIAVTASRGRGKSAALGLAVAGAVAAGFSNIL
ncbi:UNVERIFIED_CONTAM: RNA cytidine acetyltransferase 2 [Sesamum calycinum]|uniref:RNA cytidine acetyltransferase 2 n=1 Tax=Sesamum calycinum TaxID=2727403 RepID=A0AAW2N162_9LAMI